MSKRDLLEGPEGSLNEGRGAMAASRNPPLGCKPSGPSCMQMVPPVPMMRTRDSGRPASTWAVVGSGMSWLGDMVDEMLGILRVNVLLSECLEWWFYALYQGEAKRRQNGRVILAKR